jgi:hypothetical protein
MTRTLHLATGAPTFDWCHTCATTSRTTITVYALSVDGVAPVLTAVRCVNEGHGA